MVTPSYAKHPEIHLMRENLAGMIRTGRYSVNAIGPAGTNMELGHLPPLFYRGHRAGCAMTASGQTPAISLRRATHDDAQGILACLQAAFADYRDLYTPAAFLDTVLTPKTLKQRLVNMDVFVALTASGQIVGTSACHLLSPEEGHIRGMAVLPEWQGAGIAAQLLERAEAELRRRSCTRITLDSTEPLQRAMRFYEKHGFHRSGKISDFFGMPLFEYHKPLAPIERVDVAPS